MKSDIETYAKRSLVSNHGRKLQSELSFWRNLLNDFLSGNYFQQVKTILSKNFVHFFFRKHIQCTKPTPISFNLLFCDEISNKKKNKLL